MISLERFRHRLHDRRCAIIIVVFLVLVGEVFAEVDIEGLFLLAYVFGLSITLLYLLLQRRPVLQLVMEETTEGRD